MSDSEALDAARYRAIKQLYANSVGGMIEINDAALLYEEPKPGERVRMAFYPNTPVGFNEVFGDTLDEVADQLLADPTAYNLNPTTPGTG